MKRDTLEISFFFGLLAVSVGVLFLIFKPYLSALFVAAVFAIVFYPLHVRILALLKDRKTTSAVLSVVVVLFIILIPLLVMTSTLFQEASDVTTTLSSKSDTAGFIEARLNAFETHINTYLSQDIQIDFSTRAIVRESASWITDNLGSFFAGIAKGTLDIFLMIIGLFFFFRDGERIKESVIRWSPLDDAYDKSILGKMGIAINSVVKGSLFIAVIQGFLTGIGFWIFGVPSPVLWGFIATLASLIPSVGTAIVWIPGVLFLFFAEEKTGMAIGLALWGGLLVGLIDNFLRPILIERGVKIHPFLILLSVFGGISLFGPIGFLVGPVILSFVFALFEVYPKIIQTEVRN